MVLRGGEELAEADGDIAEAIDFLEFYAREALRYAQPQPVVPIEASKRTRVHPARRRGRVPPWNFAGAIMIGMTAAAIVCGNTVVLKPSSDSAIIAAWFVDLLREAGVPPGVVNSFPGRAARSATSMVTHPQDPLYLFTGSKEVGLRINELAAKTPPGQKWIKRVDCRDGRQGFHGRCGRRRRRRGRRRRGSSAFGFQGRSVRRAREPSSTRPIYDDFVDKLKERVDTIAVGDPRDPTNYMGPVVNESALKIDLGLHRNREVRGPPDRGRRAAPASRLFLAADGHRRRRPDARSRKRRSLAPYSR